MDDELQQLEAELKRLRPSEPSRRLIQRLEAELANPSAVRRRASNAWLWSAFPVAAAIAFAAISLARRPARQPDMSAVAPLKPVAAEKLLISADDEGLVTLEDGTPARRERLRYVDTITWRNPQSNASLRWSVPREEVRVVPVLFQ